MLDDWKFIIDTEKIHNAILDNCDQETSIILDPPGNSRMTTLSKIVDFNLVKSLEKHCQERRLIFLNYISPRSGSKIMEIIPEKLSFDKGILYLWCYNTQLEETQYLRVDRIKEVKVVNLEQKEYKSKAYKYTYKLTGSSALTYIPSKDENILEKTDKEVVIEANVPNKFKFIQHILSYGCDCTVLSPEDIKKEVMTKLKAMIDVYN